MAQALDRVLHRSATVEVYFGRAKDLTYVVGLVRQALEKQLGEDE